MKTLHNWHVIPVFALVCMLILSNSCKKDDTSTPASISDNNFYMLLGTSLINCYTDIYNQNLAGVVTGSHTINTDGPMGGTVLITGNTTYDNTHGITTTDLMFSMTNVNYIYSYTDGNSKTWSVHVTLTGPTTYLGSFSNTYTSVNHQSGNLYIKGSVSYDGVTRTIDSMGTVSINRSSVIAVTIFGHSVSW